MDSKKWYLSKGIWAGIVTAVIGAGTAIALLFGVDLNTNAIFGMIIAILGALGLYSRASANTTITK
jgi:uncharacterized membrane protein